MALAAAKSIIFVAGAISAKANGTLMAVTIVDTPFAPDTFSD